jgi:hypothetical protein
MENLKDHQSFCAEPARENVINAHGRNPFILVVVNQPKIQQ